MGHEQQTIYNSTTPKGSVLCNDAIHEKKSDGTVMMQCQEEMI